MALKLPGGRALLTENPVFFGKSAFNKAITIEQDKD
jgi:hypothetical protein